MTFGTLYDNVTLCKKCVATFWAFFLGGGEVRQLFIPSSGHTGRDSTYVVERSKTIRGLEGSTLAGIESWSLKKLDYWILEY